MSQVKNRHFHSKINSCKLKTITLQSLVTNQFRLQIYSKWENDKTLMRANESDYIESFRLMIYLEEAAKQIQLEKCNQTNVKLHHVVDNEFYFFVEVN